MPQTVRSYRYLLSAEKMPLTINIWVGFISNTDMSILSKGYNRLVVLEYLSKSCSCLVYVVENIFITVIETVLAQKT